MGSEKKAPPTKVTPPSCSFSWSPTHPLTHSPPPTPPLSGKEGKSDQADGAVGIDQKLFWKRDQQNFFGGSGAMLELLRSSTGGPLPP